jgi:hypothetical protein
MAPPLFVLSSVALALLMVSVSVRQKTLFDAIGAVAAILFAVGNIRWSVGDPIFRVVPFWIAFLVLTIAAERLELSRLAPPSRWRAPSFLAATSLVAIAPIVSHVDLARGGEALALGLVGVAVWLVRFDIVRRTIRQKGLPRFVATTLLGGYAWLVVAGVLLIVARGVLVAGPMYDAVLHTVFVGFVFSMLFAHAPIVFPIITGARIRSRSIPAWHVLLLHASLALRIVGDLRADFALRRAGGAVTVLSIAMFVVIMSRATMADMTTE